MINLDESWLRQRVGHFTKVKQLAFALLLCERMIPALEKFAKDEKYDSSPCRNGLNEAWYYLEKGENSPDYGRMAEQCLDQAPDTEKFSHPLTSAALNAALSITVTINFLTDGDVKQVVEAAGLARDTAALYAQSMGPLHPAL